MRVAKWLAVVVLALGASAQASEESDLSTRSHALAAKSADAASAPAPFVAQRAAPELAFRSPEAAPQRLSACADPMRTVCYAGRQGGLVYRGAREFMPRLEGLTPEGVALRHDRLVLRYSFR